MVETGGAGVKPEGGGGPIMPAMFRKPSFVTLAAFLAAAALSAAAVGQNPPTKSTPSAPRKQGTPAPARVAPETGAAAVRLQATALEGRRQPVVGAVVLVRPQSGHAYAYVTTTDARGRVRAGGIPDGVYDVEFRREGHATVVKDRVELRPAIRPVLEVMMGPGSPSVPGPAEGEAAPGAVRGDVRTPEGQVVPDATVELVRADGTLDPLRAISDGAGSFKFEGVAAGIWELEVTAVGYLPIRAPLVVAGDLEAALRVVPQPAEHQALAIDLLPPEIPFPPPGMAIAPPAGAVPREEASSPDGAEGREP